MRTNKKIKQDNINYFEIFDCGSIHRNPTPKSVVVTVLWKVLKDGQIQYGTSVKAPDDIPKPKIGKAIALRDFNKAHKYIVNAGEDVMETLITSFNCFLNTSHRLKRRVEEMKYEVYYKYKVLKEI